MLSENPIKPRKRRANARALDFPYIQSTRELSRQAGGWACMHACDRSLGRATMELPKLSGGKSRRCFIDGISTRGATATPILFSARVPVSPSLSTSSASGSSFPKVDSMHRWKARMLQQMIHPIRVVLRKSNFPRGKTRGSLNRPRPSIRTIKQPSDGVCIGCSGCRPWPVVRSVRRSVGRSVGRHTVC